MPVWHVSVCPLRNGRVSERKLRPIALKHLAPVGDREHEWSEVGPTAYHVRRRLTPEELVMVGGAVDCRGTAEGLVRFYNIRHQLSEEMLAFAMRELGTAASRSTADVPPA